MAIDTKNMVIHGTGTAFIIGADGQTGAQLMKMQNMTIEITSESEDVFGGDSLFPFYNYITSKSATFTFTNATVDLNVLAMTQGVPVSTGGEAFGNETITVKGTGDTLAITTGVLADTVECLLEDGTRLTRVSESPSTGEFSCTENGALTFGSDVTAGKVVIVSYVYTVADGSSVHVLTDSVPGYVELRHVSNVTEIPDGKGGTKKVRLYTRVYKARCDGGFNLEQTRDGATAPEVTFTSVDPERSDKRFVSYSVVEEKN